ncbi:MAG: gamma-glutamylcyclotransferase [Cyanobacteria bacterium SID2]|nr:gamma-glutamylcyclotransferase [Cyanobacteria bacterium SID2]
MLTKFIDRSLLNLRRLLRVGKFAQCSRFRILRNCDLQSSPVRGNRRANVALDKTLHSSSVKFSEDFSKDFLEGYFYYFAYGSCMCPVDLKRSLGENTHLYVMGIATLKGYRIGFHYYSSQRQCGALDILPDPTREVQGVLYRLPWRLSDRLDRREGVQQNAYRHEWVTVDRGKQTYIRARTYVVVQKTSVEIPPNDWYFNVVMRGATTCRLPEHYCWQLFQHMYKLQLAYARSDDRDRVQEIQLSCV